MPRQKKRRYPRSVISSSIPKTKKELERERARIQHESDEMTKAAFKLVFFPVVLAHEANKERKAEAKKQAAEAAKKAAREAAKESKKAEVAKQKAEAAKQAAKKTKRAKGKTQTGKASSKTELKKNAVKRNAKSRKTAKAQASKKRVARGTYCLYLLAVPAGVIGTIIAFAKMLA